MIVSEFQEKIDHFVELQKKHKNIQKNTTVKYRIAKLKKFKQAIVKRQGQIELALKEDFSKAAVETILTEIFPVISMINYTIKSLHKWSKPKKISNNLFFLGAKTYIHYEAKGNVLVISPWNYPFQLALYPMLTAFSAGNTVILKPSEFTPKTNEILRQLISDVFESHEVVLIEGEVKETQALLDKNFDHIFFTGSTPVGKIVMNKASQHLASVGLELGGKSPVVIDSQVDLEDAAKKIAWGKFVNAGQTCVAPDYILAHKDIYDDLVQLLKKEIQNLYPNIESNDDYCQIINDSHFERLNELIEEAKKMGAIIEYGGHKLNERKLEPTLLSGVHNEMRVMQEEIFGPILPLIKVDDCEQMVAFINAKDNPLSLYAFSRSKEFIEKIRQQTSSGGYSVNETILHVASSSLPFGGAGNSGIGRYHGFHGFEEMSNIRAVLKRKSNWGLHYFYPPYTKNIKKVLDVVLKKFSSFV